MDLVDLHRRFVRRWWPVLVLFGACLLVAALRGAQRVCRGTLSSTAHAKVDLIAIASARAEYSANHDGQPPASLDELVTPDANGNRYLSRVRVPRDPWNQPYVYVRSPEFNVISYGRDGVAGGEGEDADVEWRAIAGGR